MKRTVCKRWIAMLLAVAVTLGMHTSSAFGATWYLGDTTMDGAVNSVDAREVMRGVVRGYPLTGEKAALADMDGDGVQTSNDVRLILEKSGTMIADVIPLSGMEDRSAKDGSYTVLMYAEFDDTYTFTCSTARSISVSSSRGKVSGTTSVTKTMTAGEYCTVTLQLPSANAKFSMTVTPKNNTQRLPYQPNITVDPDTLDVYGNSASDPLKRATVSYSKREGGTYIYANNPEKLQAVDIGQALLRNDGLTGIVEFTYEHSNFTGQSVYLGYQLKNNGANDVFVTVENIGNQVSGEWLGQQSWSQYYNRRFELPVDYFDAYGNESDRYAGQDFLDYTPRVFQPMTYRIPAGQYIYVLGGTSADAYNTTNVANTANMTLRNGRCANGVVKFRVTGGEVSGTFYCYTKASQVKAEPAEQGFILDRDGETYGYQYKGSDNYQGLLESNLIWYVNDKTKAQNLPVTYKTTYDSYCYTGYGPYEEYTRNYSATKNQTSWVTNINPQERTGGVGSDMMAFHCVTTDGKKVVIDVNHADGYGKPANLGNWMVDYQDNMTFVNQGDTTRYFTINKRAQGALMTMVLDEKGEVLTTKCTIVPITESPDARQWELYTVEVPPHSVRQVTVSFLLMGNSYGNVTNWVVLK